MLDSDVDQVLLELSEQTSDQLDWLPHEPLPIEPELEELPPEEGLELDSEELPLEEAPASAAAAAVAAGSPPLLTCSKDALETPGCENNTMQCWSSLALVLVLWMRAGTARAPPTGTVGESATCSIDGHHGGLAPMPSYSGALPVPEASRDADVFEELDAVDSKNVLLCPSI